MNKTNFIRDFGHRIRAIHHVYYLILAIFFAVLCVYALRQNNLTAIKLRDDVVVADKAGKNVEEKLRVLREFIYSHMNGDLSTGSGLQQPVQLKYRYERLVAKEKKKTDQSNGSIYTRAQKYCEKKFPLGQVGASGGGRIGCIKDYVAKSSKKPSPIPEDLYKFDFISPRWSPDLAGWSLVFAFVFFGLWIFSVVSKRRLHHRVRDL
jgi:hypothetical protein